MSLLGRFTGHLGSTPLWVRLRLIFGVLLLLPVGTVVVLLSILRAVKWRSRARCRGWLKRHQDAFPGVDPRSVWVESHGGGVSNASSVWHCRTTSGEPVEYFVKVFLPLGTLWAKICPWLSPFPKIRGANAGERLKSERNARLELARQRIAVPALLYCDPANHLTISERLHGEMVNDLLRRAQERGALTPEDREILGQCGRGLAKIHAAGFSVIDAQAANCMWVPDRGRVYFIDLEFSTLEDQRHWDLEFFLAYVSAQLSGPLEEEGLRLVREGYLTIQPTPRAAPRRIRRLLVPFVPVFRAILEIRRGSPSSATKAAQP